MVYVTHTKKEYSRVLRLRNKHGWSAAKIFSFLSKQGEQISYGAISDWIYTNKKSFQDKVWSKITPQSSYLTSEKSYILGVLCGDGYIRTTGKGHYLVGLDVTDEDFADEFRMCLKKTYGLLPSKSFSNAKITNFTRNAKPRYRINLTSKLAVQDLLKYSKSFKTKEWEVPEEILKSNQTIKSAFLRGLFDSDGSISLKKPFGAYLYVCSWNKEPLLEIKKILEEDFKIKLSFIYNSSASRLKSSGYLNIKHYEEKIGFTLKRKKEKLRIGLSTYKRKGIKRYPLSFKRNALFLLDKYQDLNFVSQLLNVNTGNLYDWKNGKYLGGIK